MNIGMLLDMAADAHADRVAVTCDGVHVTYGELRARSWAAAARMRESGCRHAALLATNGLSAPIALFGSAYAGVPYVPLNYRLAAAEIEALMSRIAPALVIAQRDHAANLLIPPGVQIAECSSLLQKCEIRDQSAFEPEDLGAIAVQLFTSGTTGKPKAAVLRHEHIISYILGTVEFGSALAHEAALVSVPPYHIAGISALLSSTYAGRRIVLLPSFDAREWLRLCHAENVSSAFLVPTMLARIVDQFEASNAAGSLPALRAIAYGGGRMPLAVIERAMRLLPHVEFTNAYGLTETSSTICLLGPQAHREAATSGDPIVQRRLMSVGQPLSSVEIEIRDSAGHVLGPSSHGSIFVRGGQVAGEYQSTGSTLDWDGWFATRDRGWRDEDGYLYLDGREDDIIVRGGENISPGEVEDVLLSHPAVEDAAVFAVPSDEWGEAVAAALVLKPDFRLNIVELQQWVRARLRSSRVPERIVLRDQLPYNETGKLLRRVLREEVTKAPPFTTNVRSLPS